MSLSSPYLITLQEEYVPDEVSLYRTTVRLLMKVWNIETSTKLYSFEVYSIYSDSAGFLGLEFSILGENNLVKVASRRFQKIFIFDGSNIEDRESVIESKRELSLGDGDALCDILFNKTTCAYRSAGTITFMNFWK